MSDPGDNPGLYGQLQKLSLTDVIKDLDYNWLFFFFFWLILYLIARMFILGSVVPKLIKVGKIYYL